MQPHIFVFKFFVGCFQQIKTPQGVYSVSFLRGALSQLLSYIVFLKLEQSYLNAMIEKHQIKTVSNAISPEVCKHILF